MSYKPIFDPIKDRSLDPDRCFLCGVGINKKNRSAEHIFPDWLLKKFDLWDERLVLLNRTSIPYREIKIPCCKECNNIHLGKLEAIMERATDGGYEKFSKLPKEKVFLWLQKIFYEMLYLELRLFFDRSDEKKGTIINKEMLETYRMCHLFLQSARINTRFHEPYPWSVFIFKLQKNGQTKLDFDFKDDIFSLNIAIRMGDIGVIACLQDNNSQEQIFEDEFRKIKKHSLHPMQFNELIARIFYKESLRNRIPKYMTFLGKDHLEIVSLPLVGLSSKPIYDDWILSEYAKWVSLYLNMDYNQCFEPPDKVFSTLKDILK
jgi:hypothetical protein